MSVKRFPIPKVCYLISYEELWRVDYSFDLINTKKHEFLDKLIKQAHEFNSHTPHP